MAHCIQIRHELRATLPASFVAVEEFIYNFRRSLQFLSRKDWFETELVVREALNNAVLHGSKEIPEQRINCVLRMTSKQFVVTVTDEGNGFPWHASLEAEASEDASCGRGMEIYRKYANRVRFNTKGNRVTIIKRFKENSWQKR